MLVNDDPMRTSGGSIDLSLSDPSGCSPLHLVVGYKAGDRVIFAELMQSGASTNAADMKGDTPLHIAIKHVDDIADAEQMALEMVSAPRTDVQLVGTQG